MQRQIEEKDDYIEEITQNQAVKGKGKRGGGNFSQKDEMDALEAENEELRSQNEAGQLTISDLREQLSNSNVKCTTLQNEKSEADKKIRTQAKRLEELEKDIVEVNNRGRSAELQSKEFNKQKSANVKEAQRLWDENESLKDEVWTLFILCFQWLEIDNHECIVFPLPLQIKQAEAQMRAMEEEKVIMESMIAKLADEKDELATKVGSMKR